MVTYVKCKQPLALSLRKVDVLAQEISQKHNIQLYVHKYLHELNINHEEVYFTQPDLPPPPPLPDSYSMPAIGAQSSAAGASSYEMECCSSKSEASSSDTEESYFNIDDNVEATVEALNEILRIQATLKGDEVVGYIYSDSSDVDEETHFECFIISRNSIIKPIHWPYLNTLGGELLNPYVMAEKFLNSSTYHYAATDLSRFNGGDLTPQADGYSCASLCLSYVKNLLKENASQLKTLTLTLTLTVPYYNANNEIEYLFIPSPQVLKYSQSSQINSFYQQLLKHDPNNIDSLENQLRKFMDKLKDEADFISNEFKKNLFRQTKQTLQQLSEFVHRWLHLYEINAQKRSLMKDGFNHYLTYTSYRFWKKTTLKTFIFPNNIESVIAEINQKNIFIPISQRIFDELDQNQMMSLFLSKIPQAIRAQYYWACQESNYGPFNWKFFSLYPMEIKMQVLTSENCH